MIIKFESFADFVAESQKPPASLLVRTGTASSRDRDRSGWYGTNKFEDAVKLAAEGWREGADKILSILSQLGPSVRASIAQCVRRTSFDVSGNWVDVGRFLSGEPECFGIEVEDGDNCREKVVRIVVNLASSLAIDADAFFARGAVVVAAIDILEASGVRCELWACRASRRTQSPHNGRTVEIHTCVKQAGEPVDIDRVAFVLSHVACYRRLFFSVGEQHEHSSCGASPCPVTHEDGDIVVGHLNRESAKRQNLIAEIAKICTAAGVEIDEEEIARLASAGI
jgi:hypothetical protein